MSATRSSARGSRASSAPFPRTRRPRRRGRKPSIRTTRRRTTSSRSSRPERPSRSSTAWSATTGRRAGSGTGCARGAGQEVSSLVDGIVADITERRKASDALEEARRQLQHIAFHDPLTGLPNRVSFQERLDEALDRCPGKKCGAAVLFIDLDNFKLINDSFGHAAGDELLRAVAGRLQRATRTADVVARQGGDEFLVLLADIEPNGNEDDPEYARKAAAVVARKIRRTLLAPLRRLRRGDLRQRLDRRQPLPRRRARLGDSPQARGHRDVPREGRGPRLPCPLCARPRRRAHAAFDGGAPAHGDRRGDGLVLHYQPLVRLDSAEIIGAEALIRWQDGERLVPPADFLPLAERTGLMAPSRTG